MRFLFKIAFWFSLVLLVIPLGESSTKKHPLVPGQTPAEPVGAFDTFLAAREAITDVGAICDRKPTVCEVGLEAMNTVGVRAREVARIAFEMLDANFGRTDSQMATGSVPKEQVPPETQADVQRTPAKAHPLPQKAPRPGADSAQ